MTQAARRGSSVELGDLVERHVASVCTSTEHHRLRHTISVLHELVMDVVGEQGLAPAGPLFTRYHRQGRIVTLEAGIPLAQPIHPLGIVSASTLPGGPTLHVRYKGGHEQTTDRCTELERYCRIHGLRPVGAPWECYLVDGRDSPDEREWLTDVYLPVRAVQPRVGHVSTRRQKRRSVTFPRLGPSAVRFGPTEQRPRLSP